MSGISQIGTIMNMVGISKDLAPQLAAQATGAAQTGFGADSMTISPMAQMMMQQLANMDLQTPGEQGESELGGLAQLKQRGEMLASMLNVKLKNFESNLMSGLKTAGLDPTQDMAIKNGDDGLMLLNDPADKAAVEKHLNAVGNVRGQFEELSQMAKLLELLGQTSALSGAKNGAGASHAAQYAKQSILNNPVEKKAEASLVVQVINGNASYSFE